MRQSAEVWLTRVAAILGPLAVAPFAYAQVFMLQDDSPDGTTRSSVVMLAAQVFVMVAFLATLWRWPLRAVTLLVSIVAYSAAAAFAAWDNGGWPVAAAIVWPAAPALLAVPVVVLDLLGHRSRPADA